MAGISEPVGTLDVALAHTVRLLESDPELAAEQAAEILKIVPDHAQASMLQADAWRAIGDQLTARGDVERADAAYARYIKVATRDPRLIEAAAALAENCVPVAEALLRKHLMRFPTDVPAIRMLAEVAARLGRYVDAENLLVRCLELAPCFVPARHNYAIVLHRQHKSRAALREVELLLAVEPNNPGYRNLQAAVLSRFGDYPQALETYASVLAQYPKQAKVWMSYGHALKTAGRRDESIAAYRRSIEIAPHLGEAYWSLANLKTFRFTPAEIATMRAQLTRPDLSPEDRLHFEFALGKALEDGEAFAESFHHYANGNRLRRSAIRYDADENREHVARSKALFTAEFFAARASQGAPDPAPIFIVGLPRSGSTLLEQILASHSAVEGTMELPDIISIARSLDERRVRSQPSKYPEALASLDADALRGLGERYLTQTRPQRRRGTPFFVDKMPNNFLHVGLIHLALPNAKIVDARRHPLGCCFSAYKQHFARGQNFTYDLQELGRYYHDYVELMAHFDEVLPGGVHRVIYENLIDDTETEVRRLLDYCGLPFETGCLRFYDNERVVRTASSEQVRRPIYRDGVEHWQHYEPWLGPLKDVLEPVLAAYPAIPDFHNSQPGRSSI